MELVHKDRTKEKAKDYIVKNIFDNESIEKLHLLDEVNKGFWMFDFKSALFDNEFAESIAYLFWEEVLKIFPNETHFVIGGLESGALPVVSAVVLFHPKKFTVSGFYIRKSQKKSDLAKKIEGDIPEGVLILVDDILNKGDSFTKASLSLEKEARYPDLFFSIIRYRDADFYKGKIFKAPLFSIFELDDFFEKLGTKNLLSVKLENKHSFKYDLVFSKKISVHNPYYVIPKSAPLLKEGSILQGQDDGSFVALSKYNGDVLWKYQVFFGDKGKRIFSSPVFFRDQVFFGAYDGNLYSLDIKTGKRKWVFFDADWIGSSPCIAPDIGIVFIGLEFGLFRKKGGLAAVDVETGKLVWSYYEMEGLTHATPAYSEKQKIVVCGCNDGKIYSFDAKTGKLKWVFKTQGEIKYGAIFNKKESLCFVGSMDGSVYVLETKTGKFVKKYETMFGVYSNPALHKDIYLIVGSLDKNIYCWDIRSNELVWKIKTNGRIFATPLISKEGRGYLGSNDGIVRVFDPFSGAILGMIATAERVVNKVIVDQGKVYVPTHTGELLCFKEQSQ